MHECNSACDAAKSCTLEWLHSASGEESLKVSSGRRFVIRCVSNTGERTNWHSLWPGWRSQGAPCTVNGAAITQLCQFALSRVWECVAFICIQLGYDRGYNTYDRVTYVYSGCLCIRGTSCWYGSTTFLFTE